MDTGIHFTEEPMFTPPPTVIIANAFPGVGGATAPRDVNVTNHVVNLANNATTTQLPTQIRVNFWEWVRNAGRGLNDEIENLRRGIWDGRIVNLELTENAGVVAYLTGIDFAGDTADITPLQFAYRLNDLELIQIIENVLVRHNANCCQAVTGAAPLIEAVRDGNFDLVWQIITLGVDVNATIGENGLTALAIAADVFNRNFYNIVIRAKMLDIIKLLLIKGAVPNQAALEILIRNATSGVRGYLKIAKQGYPQQFKNLINTPLSDGTTLLMVAAGRDLPVFEFLVDAGADLRAVDSDNFTVLMRASRDGHIEIVRSLLYFAEEIEEVDKLAAKEIAKQNGQKSIVDLLSLSAEELNQRSVAVCDQRDDDVGVRGRRQLERVRGVNRRRCGSCLPLCCGRSGRYSALPPSLELVPTARAYFILPEGNQDEITGYVTHDGLLRHINDGNINPHSCMVTVRESEEWLTVIQAGYRNNDFNIIALVENILQRDPIVYFNIEPNVPSLLQAVRRGDFNLVWHLIVVDHIDVNGIANDQTALATAADGFNQTADVVRRTNLLDIIKLLLAKGATPTQAALKILIERAAHGVERYLAIINANYRGSFVPLVNTPDGNGLLAVAAIGGRNDIVQDLIFYVGDNVDIDRLVEARRLALENGHKHIVILLDQELTRRGIRDICIIT